MGSNVVEARSSSGRAVTKGTGAGEGDLERLKQITLQFSLVATTSDWSTLIGRSPLRLCSDWLAYAIKTQQKVLRPKAGDYWVP